MQFQEGVGRHDIGSVFLKAELDITPITKTVGKIDSILTNTLTRGLNGVLGTFTSQLTNGVRDSISIGFGRDTQGQIADGFAKGMAQGLVGGLTGAAVSTISSTIGSAIELAVTSRLDLVKGILTGYANSLFKGLSEYGTEQRSVRLASFVAGRRELDPRASDREKEVLNKQILDTFTKGITEVATELSYSRADIAKLGQDLLKSGFSSERVFGGQDAGSRRSSLMSQTAYLAEAAALPSHNIEEASRIMAQLASAYSEESTEKIANQVLAMTTNSIHEFSTLRYGYQDSAPAAAQAGISLTDMNQVMVMLTKLSTPQVAGTLAKTLFLAMADTKGMDRQIYQAIAPDFDPELEKADLNKGSGFIPLLREEGKFVNTLVQVRDSIREALSTGKIGQLEGQKGSLDTAKAFNEMGSQAQEQLVFSKIKDLFGGGVTLTSALLPILRGAEEDKKALTETMLRFNERDREGNTATQALIKVKQGGILGASELISSSVENVRVALASKLEPAFVHMVTFFTDLANKITPLTENFSGGLQRISDKIVNFFSGVDKQDRLEQFSQGIQSLFSQLNVIFESWTDAVVDFVSEEGAIEAMFVNLKNLIHVSVQMFNNFFMFIRKLLPLVNGLTGAADQVGAWQKGDALKNEAKNSESGVSSKGMNFAEETGDFKKDLGLGDLANTKEIRQLTEEEKALLTTALLNSPHLRNKFRTGRVKTNLFGLADDENVGLGKDPEKIAAAVENARALGNSGLFIEGGTDDSSQVYRITDEGKLSKDKKTISTAREYINQSNLRYEQSNEGIDPLTGLPTFVPAKGTGRKRIIKQTSKDLSREALGGFLSEEEYSAIIDPLFKEVQSGVKSLEVAQAQMNQRLLAFNNKKIESVFGKGSFLNASTGNIEGVNLNKLSSEGLMGDKTFLRSLISAMSGEQGDRVQKSAQRFSQQRNVEDTFYGRYIAPILSGKITTDKGGNTFAVSAEAIESAISGGAGDTEQITKALADFSSNWGKKYAQQIIKGGSADRILDQLNTSVELDRGLSGDKTSIYRGGVRELKSASLAARDRGDLKEEARLSRATQMLEQMAKLSVSKAPQDGKDSGIVANLEGLQTMIMGYRQENLTLAQEELALRQRLLETQRKINITSIAYQGIVNNTLSEFAGLIGETESAIQSNNNAINANKQKLEQEQADLLKKMGQNLLVEMKDYRGYSVAVPTSQEVGNQIDTNLVQEQTKRIDRLLAKEENLSKVNQSKLKEMEVMVSNIVTRTLQESFQTLSSMFNSTLSVTQGSSSAFTSRFNEVLTNVNQQSVSLSQQLQALRAIKKFQPEAIGKKETQQLGNIEDVFKSIPNFLKQALDEILKSFKLEMGSFFQDLKQKQISRTNELVGMTSMFSSLGNALGLLSAPQQLQADLFSNSQEIEKLELERLTLARQLSMVEISKKLGMGDFVAEKEYSTRVGISSVESRQEGLELERESLKKGAANKSELSIYNSFISTFKEMRELGTEFSSERVNTLGGRESKISESNLRLIELNQTIDLLSSIANTHRDTFGELSLVNTQQLVEAKKYVARMAEVNKALQAMELSSQLESIENKRRDAVTQSAVDYRSDMANYYTQLANLKSSEDSSRSQKEAAAFKVAALDEDTMSQLSGLDAKYDSQLADLRNEYEQLSLSIKENTANLSPESLEVANAQANEMLTQISVLEANKVREQERVINSRREQLELIRKDLSILEGMKTQLASTLKSAFGNLYDVLTSEGKTIGEKFKEFGNNLLKGIGKIGWDWMMNQLLDPITKALTKKDTSVLKKPQYTRPFTGDVPIDSAAAVDTPYNLESLATLRDMMLKGQGEEIAKINGIYQNFLNETESLGGSMGTRGASRESIDRQYEKYLSTIAKTPDLGGFLVNASMSGEEGAAQNASLQSSYQSKMVESLLGIQDSTSETVAGINNLSSSIDQFGIDLVNEIRALGSGGEGYMPYDKPQRSVTPTQPRNNQPKPTTRVHNGVYHDVYDQSGRNRNIYGENQPKPNPAPFGVNQPKPNPAPTGVNQPKPNPNPYGVNQPGANPPRRKPLGEEAGDIIQIGKEALQHGVDRAREGAGELRDRFNDGVNRVKDGAIELKNRFTDGVQNLNNRIFNRSDAGSQVPSTLGENTQASIDKLNTGLTTQVSNTDLLNPKLSTMGTNLDVANQNLLAFSNKLTTVDIGNGVANPGASKGLEGEIPVMSQGGMIDKAMQKERSQSGKTPLLAVLHEGEHVLSTLNGDADAFRRLQESGQWDKIKKGGMVPNFANGGEAMSGIMSLLSQNGSLAKFSPYISLIAMVLPLLLSLRKKKVKRYAMGGAVRGSSIIGGLGLSGRGSGKGTVSLAGLSMLSAGGSSLARDNKLDLKAMDIKAFKYEPSNYIAGREATGRMTPEERRILDFQNAGSQNQRNQAIEVKMETVSVGGVNYVSEEQTRLIAKQVAEQSVNNYHKKFTSSRTFRNSIGI